MAQGIRDVYSQHLNDTLPSVFDDVDEPKHYIQPSDIPQVKSNEQLVLINFDPGTDGSGLRSKVWQDLCAKEISYVTCFTKPGGVQIDRIPEIYKRNRQYPFWLSPRGNGLDCHRTWEALYLNRIPIVWNDTLVSLYENLPVLIINSHHELNVSFLQKKLKEITSKKDYQYEKLRHAYWRRLILDKSRHRNRSSRENQCWRANNKIR